MNCANCGQTVRSPDEHHAVKGYTCKPKDTRYTYGATCTWHGPIDKVGKMDFDRIRVPRTLGDLALETLLGRKEQMGLPCCPHCQGPLFEVPSREEYFDAARHFEQAGNPKIEGGGGPHPGYVTVTEYLAECGQCYPLKDGFPRIVIQIAARLILEKRLRDAEKKLRDAEAKQ